MKVISGILILITAFLSFKHGWDGLHMAAHPEQAKMMESLGIGKKSALVFSVITLLVGIMVLFPQTFFLANLINALSILVIMALSLNAGNSRTALIEVPFLLIPLVLIYLGHPFKK
ncbi:MAG TPA: hypothetical protein VNS58_11825 [Puia sp.]|nr:hypothetical protein [Puia sp.]